MGAGIAAAIPLVIKPHERDVFRGLDQEDFAPGFIDNYDVEERDSQSSSIQVMRDGTVIKPKDRIYTIKEDLLIDNYRSFLTEFYCLIDENLHKKTGLTHDDLPSAGNYDEFVEVFGKDSREGYAPFVYHGSYAFSVLGCRCEQYWIFYCGSYKAYLEVYNTFLHFEKILAKAMSNPLANAIKFGIFG